MSVHFTMFLHDKLSAALRSFPDKVRGVMNEGGLFGEREGWHLPGFDTTSWAPRALSAGLPNGTAGVGLLVTTFELDVPAGVDAMMSFVFDGGSGTVAAADGGLYRALLFVDGWQFGEVRLLPAFGLRPKSWIPCSLTIVVKRSSPSLEASWT